jgi:hypothetical protein
MELLKSNDDEIETFKNKRFLDKYLSDRSINHNANNLNQNAIGPNDNNISEPPNFSSSGWKISFPKKSIWNMKRVIPNPWRSPLRYIKVTTTHFVEDL